MERSVPARLLAVSSTTLLAVLAGSAVTGAPSGGATGSSTYTHVLAAHSPASSARQARSHRWAGSISVQRKSAVEAAYERSFAPGLDQATGWTGDDAHCRVGSTSSASRAATLRAVNFVRAMSGLAPVSFTSTLNARAQRTALMMSANQALSHQPPRSWRCWTAAGASNAGRSNLALSYPSITSAGLVGLYMSEPGTENTAVGHRRWLLNPFATRMGSGSTTTANAITVIGPTAANRPNPAWVSWPTAGWFPDTLEPAGRWSLSAGNRRTDFSRATVHVYRDGQALRTMRQRVENGYAQPTLVWQIPPGQATSGTYRVVVRGVRHQGTSTLTGRTYVVRMFTPGS